MKTCIIGLRGLPNVAGGIETHCENLLARLARMRPQDQIVVIGRRGYVGDKDYLTEDGVRVVPLPAIRNKYLETFSNTLLGVLAARFRLRAGAVHLHALGPGLFAPLARLLGMRVLLTHHGDDFLRARWNRVARAVLRLGERLGVRFSDQVIAVSPSLARRLATDYPAQAARISYIPNGADHILNNAGDDDGLLDRFGLRDADYVVSVGRLVPEKAFLDLIAAHRASGSDHRLVIVGGPGGGNHHEDIAAQVDDRVVLTGNLPPEGVACLLRPAALFVLASHHEGLPIAALEAAAMGTPLLLSDIQANLDLGMAAEHYFPVGDIDALAARLAPDAAPLPPSDVMKAFNWDSIARQTARIYDRLDAGPETAPPGRATGPGGARP